MQKYIDPLLKLRLPGLLNLLSTWCISHLVLLVTSDCKWWNRQHFNIDRGLGVEMVCFSQIKDEEN